jgi:23S rRNA pseudouridine955/2504/2580 synthase
VRAVAEDDDDGRRSITLVQVVVATERFSLLDVTIKTGRTHQIRVHLAHEGHVIVGDEKYGDFALNKALSRSDAPGGVPFARMALHARRLVFAHPGDGRTLTLESPTPESFARLVAGR